MPPCPPPPRVDLPQRATSPLEICSIPSTPLTLPILCVSHLTSQEGQSVPIEGIQHKGRSRNDNKVGTGDQAFAHVLMIFCL